MNLVREPQNKYDRWRIHKIYQSFVPAYMRFRNAIQVKNIAGQQVGHIPRENASNLAPLLDQRLVTVEGVILEGNRTFPLIHY